MKVRRFATWLNTGCTQPIPYFPTEKKGPPRGDWAAIPWDVAAEALGTVGDASAARNQHHGVAKPVLDVLQITFETMGGSPLRLMRP